MFLRRKFLGVRRYTELEDIRENLQAILTSKRGSSFFLETFGVTETGYRTPEEMITQLMREIQENIKLYEPRLKVVEIDEVYGDNGAVRLEVQCALKSTSERLKIVMAGNGTFVSVSDGKPVVDEDK